MKIDWAREPEKVRDAVFAVMKAQDIFESMSDAEKERFDYLCELLTEPKEEVKQEVPKEEVNKNA